MTGPDQHRRQLVIRSQLLGWVLQVNPVTPSVWRERVRGLLVHWAGKLHTRDRDITPVMCATALLPGAFSRAYDGCPPLPRREA